MKKSLVLTIILTAALVIIAACTKSTNVSTGKPIATVAINKLTATLSNASGQLKQGDQEVTLAFTDSSGKPVDVHHHKHARRLQRESEHRNGRRVAGTTCLRRPGRNRESNVQRDREIRHLRFPIANCRLIEVFETDSIFQSDRSDRKATEYANRQLEIGNRQ